jgi:hypothetical protein
MNTCKFEVSVMQGAVLLNVLMCKDYGRTAESSGVALTTTHEDCQHCL